MKKGALFAIAVTLAILDRAAAQPPLPPPHFHHLALNSTDPDAAIAFYMKEFPSTSSTTWEGMPALTSPDHVLIVFRRWRAPPPCRSQCHRLLAFRLERRRLPHQRWKTFRAQNLLVPFYTDDQGDFVGISSDTYPYPPGVPGRTRAQMAEAMAQNLEPSRVGRQRLYPGPR